MIQDLFCDCFRTVTPSLLPRRIGARLRAECRTAALDILDAGPDALLAFGFTLPKHNFSTLLCLARRTVAVSGPGVV
jgi:hypothetical protein